MHKDCEKSTRRASEADDPSGSSAENERYVADARGYSYRLPPPGLSALERLAWANAHLTPAGMRAQVPVKPDELGVSPAEFAKLGAERKLALVNAALARRVAEGRPRG